MSRLPFKLPGLLTYSDFRIDSHQQTSSPAPTITQGLIPITSLCFSVTHHGSVSLIKPWLFKVIIIPPLTYELRDKTLTSLKTHGSLKKKIIYHNSKYFGSQHFLPPFHPLLSPPSSNPHSPTTPQNFPVGGFWAIVSEYGLLKSS